MQINAIISKKFYQYLRNSQEKFEEIYWKQIWKFLIELFWKFIQNKLIFLNKSVIVCESDNYLIKCSNPDEGIRIKNATYGRTNGNVCLRPPYNTLNCVSDQSIYFSRICNMVNQCFLEADNMLFPDPCPGNTKYLEV